MPPPRATSANHLRERFRRAQALHQAGRLADAGAIYQDILRLNPRHADAMHFLGLIALQTNHPEQGVHLIERAIALNPSYPEALGNLALGYADLGRHHDALASFDKALALKPDAADLHDNRGTVLRDLGRSEAAVASHNRAIALRPNDAGAFSNRGNALRDLHRYEEALASYDRAITLQPQFIEASCNRASLLQAMHRYDEALVGFDGVLARHPNHAEAHRGRGNVLRDMQRPDDALVSFNNALAQAPTSAAAHNDHGSALFDLRRYDEALSSFAKALSLHPNFAQAHNNHGNALQALQRFDEALASYGNAIALKPDYAQAYYNRGNLLVTMQLTALALADYDRAVALQPDHATAHRARGLTLTTLRRYQEALASFATARQLDPSIDWLPGDILSAKRQIADWDDSLLIGFEQCIWQGQKVASPFTLMALPGSSALHRKAAEIFANCLYPADDSLPPLAGYAGHTRIRLGYFSADFRDHAMMHVMVGLFGWHDRSRFELTAFSFGPDTEDEWRQRVISAFDRFIDVRAMSDRDVALLARHHQIDIAIDLMGFTKSCRTGIFGCRAAPVQAAYLGYPGTMGTGYIDYIIADRVLIPDGIENHYSEKIVYLPDTYQVNDRNRPVPACTQSRTEHRLPETGFIFCCFNNTYKISPRSFEVWMRILRRVPGSVLWLFAENADAADNLRHEASTRNIAPDRLIFAKRVPLPEHLARQCLAGLFLDTLPYNGHATSSLALWAGLPVLTQLGDTFPGRVAASLLHAIGLPELITTTADAYEARAVELATNLDRLRTVKTRLEANRLTTPLFDTMRFTRHLEAAYEAMHARATSGKPPADITVDALRDPATLRR